MTDELEPDPIREASFIEADWVAFLVLAELAFDATAVLIPGRDGLAQPYLIRRPPLH